MDQKIITENHSKAQTPDGKSWSAYKWLMLLLLFTLIPISLACCSSSWPLRLFVSGLALVYIASQILLIRSYNIYHDDIGIWAYSGIFPWGKGAIEVKWRDLDEAVYFHKCWSWLFISCSIRIGHQFKKSSKTSLTHMHKNKETNLKINDRHQELVNTDGL